MPQSPTQTASSSEPETYDAIDALVGYLRRFLLEARIGTLLEPIFDHVQHGGVNDESATQGALEELADVLHRAIRGAAQAPGDDDETAT